MLHGEVRLDPVRAYRVIGACAILHNLAVSLRDNNVFPEPLLPEDDMELVVGDNQRRNRDGRLVRDQLVQQNFF